MSQPVYYCRITFQVSTVFDQYCSNICLNNTEKTILSPADSEVRSVIRYLQAEENGAAQSQLKNGRTDVHNEGGRGSKSIMTEDVVHQVDRENRRFTISDLSTTFPEISRSTLHGIVSENLGYHKFCARWVPKQNPTFSVSQEFF